MKQFIQRLVLAPEAFSVVVLILAIPLLAAASPYFLTSQNVSQLFTQNLEIAIMALALAPLVIVREIDLSVGSILALSAVVFGKFIEMGAPWLIAAVAALAAGAVAGLFNGIMVTRFGLSSIVVTLATMALFRGLANVIVSDETIVGFPEGFAGWDSWYVPGTLITVPQILFVPLALVVGIALATSTWGRRIYFIGSSPGVARATAVPVDRIKIALFMGSGLAAALAGLVLSSRLDSVRADTGTGFELLALTVVLLGGVSILGGRGSIAGVVVAVVLVGALRSGMALAGQPDQARIALIGLLLLLSIVTNVGIQRLQQSMRRRRSLKLLTTPDIPKPAQSTTV
ncbi:ABC transporter permease [Salinibacterium sp. TMP30]|uniref:ABC transporter permease n=1 Tax=Salinibacterium sp. TMP30 TaxID=3138237 RepID=UPI00313A11D9